MGWGLGSGRKSRETGTSSGCRVRSGCLRKNNKRDCCKAPGNRCFPFGACREKAQRGAGGERWKEEEEKPRQTGKRRARIGRDEDERVEGKPEAGRESKGTKGIREGPLTLRGQQGPCGLG